MGIEVRSSVVLRFYCNLEECRNASWFGVCVVALQKMKYRNYFNVYQFLFEDETSCKMLFFFSPKSAAKIYYCKTLFESTLVK